MGDDMIFFKINAEYLTEKSVKWYFIIDLILGAVALGVAMQLYGTKWGLMFSVVSIVCIVDCCLLRYFYELKATIKKQ
jgi:membrane protein implicated in regulation of membrane protease activity